MIYLPLTLPYFVNVVGKRGSSIFYTIPENYISTKQWFDRHADTLPRRGTYQPGLL